MGGKINKREVVKEILKKITEGMSPEKAKDELLKKVDSITSEELFEIENSLISDGVSPEEIKKFCNVHSLLFENMFENKVSDPQSEVHPINLFKKENREVEKLLKKLREENLSKKEMVELLNEISKVDIHYERKEQIVFPYLERRGFFGPTQVMWGKDNEIRELIKKAIENVDKEDFRENYLEPMLSEIEGMIFKEENILFPTCLEKLHSEDWTNIFKESAQVGYVFIEPPKEVFEAIDIEKSKEKYAQFSDGFVHLPTGVLSLEEIRNIFNFLPVDVTFIDKDDKVKFFSDNKERIFLRTKAVIGREVRNCHPPQSLELVEKVIEDLKNRKRNFHDFWLTINGRMIYIRYFGVFDEFGKYLGIIEITQDITEIKKIEGEKRLIDG